MNHHTEPERRKVVFAGDSVTDCGRRADAARLGDGYVRRLAQNPLLAAHALVNRGISGDRAGDLLARWQKDVLDLNPVLVSILIGINDVWRRYSTDEPTSVGDFEANYRALLEPLADRGTAVVLVEPFVLPVNDAQRAWKDDLDPKLDVVHGLAAEFGATLVRAHTRLNSFASEVGAAVLAPDGVHPSAAGHDRLAAIWLAETSHAVGDLPKRATA